MSLFSWLTGQSMPARSDAPMASRSSPLTMAWRTFTSVSTPALVLKVMWRQFGPAALRTAPSATPEASWKAFGSGPMSKASISPLTKAFGVASGEPSRAR